MWNCGLQKYFFWFHEKIWGAQFGPLFFRILDPPIELLVPRCHRSRSYKLLFIVRISGGIEQKRAIYHRIWSKSHGQDQWWPWMTGPGHRFIIWNIELIELSHFYALEGNRRKLSHEARFLLWPGQDTDHLSYHWTCPIHVSFMPLQHSTLNRIVQILMVGQVRLGIYITCYEWFCC